MAEPAYEQLEEYQVPAGGIADFIVPDEEIEAMDREDAERAFGDSGIANFKEVAARMADYGRYGDDTVAHVQTGEIVIPAALIADNPTLKESIFDDLRARGIDDPERYVVGSPENSINPETGLPEFFLKKIFKGVKKAFKKVGKFLKKAATIVLPIALSFTPLGPVFGSALGSGIASLINGGSLKDAFKAAAIAGATGGVLKGIGSVMQGGTFMGGIKEAVQIGPFAPAGAGAGAAGANVPVVDAVPSVSGGELTAKGLQEAAAAKASGAASGLAPVSDAVPAFTQGAPAAAQAVQAGPGAINITAGGQPFAPLSASQALSAASPAQAVTSAAQPGGLQAAMAASPSFAGTPTAPLTMSELVGQPPSAMDAALSTASTAPATAAQIAAQKTAQAAQGPIRRFIPDSVENLYKDYLAPGRNELTSAEILDSDTYKLLEPKLGGEKAFELASKELQPGLINKYGPLAALGLGAAYVGGAFETPEVERPGLIPSYTGMDLLRQNPEQYNLSYTGRTPAPLPGQEGYSPLQYIADGGEVFPRRNGGIMPHEGVPDEDSVRAMLMPGEFVMTKDAVKGLGGGNLDQGIKNMYSVMRDLERRGRAA